jgi:hypothetical protein
MDEQDRITVAGFFVVEPDIAGRGVGHGAMIPCERQTGFEGFWAFRARFEMVGAAGIEPATPRV